MVPTITDRDFTIATIVGRTAEEATGEGEAEAAEAGEVAAAKPGAKAEGADKEKPKEEKKK